MLAGELYSALVPELAAERTRARNLLKELNDSHERDQELRVAVIDQPFASDGQGIWIEPPLFRKIYLSSPR
jgi:maltose O-acetyltransferase